MILKNATIFSSIAVLSQASGEKGLLGYAIAVNLRKMKTEAQEYARKRDELLAKYGMDAGGGKYTLTPEDARAFDEELRPFSEMEVEVPVMQVTPETFYGGELTSAQMYALSWMVKE